MQSKMRRKLLKEVVSFLNCFDKIYIHQFGTNILYHPIYSLLDKLQNIHNIHLEYKDNKRSDVDAVHSVAEEHNGWVIPDGTIKKYLNIGLSELNYGHFCECFNTYKATKKNDLFFDKPIVERIPVWGVSLKNNPKINKVLHDKTLSKSDHLSTVKYWEHFSSKFSRMDISDYANLVVSLYPSRSTMYRKFVEELKKADIFKKVTLAEISEFAKEFDDLFSGIADISLTMTPSFAICRAEKEFKNIEIVYNHLDTPYEYTHIYIKLFSSKDNGKNNIIKHFLECFAILIQYEAGDLYRQKYGRNFDRYKKDQCPQRDNKCFKHNCAVPARIMLNLFNDSRVYLYTPDMDDKVNNLMSRNTIRTLVENWQQDNYHLHGQSDQNMSNDKILEKYFPYNWINNIDNIKSEPHVQEALLDKDPIYLMSKLWRTNKTYRETKNDHKSVEDRLNSDMTHAKNVKIGFVKDTNDKLDQKVKVAVSKIKKYYELGNGNTKRIKDIYFESDTEENINTHWDKNGWRWTISDLCKLIHPEYVRKQTDSIEFYYPKNLLAGAFHHLKVDIDNHFTVVSITAGEIKGNDLLLDGKKYQQYLCYMLFEYNSKKKGEPHKFVDINWNPIGRAILNGYWFNKNSGINKHPFPKHHFNCCTLANDIINFDYNNGLYNLNIKSEEAWLFTFKSIKNTSTRKIL